MYVYIYIYVNGAAHRGEPQWHFDTILDVELYYIA